MNSIYIFILIFNVFEEKIIEKPNFNDLQDKINNLSDGKLDIDQDYIFNLEKDKTEGIMINKSLIIYGQNHEINGLNKSKIFKITNAVLTLININFVNGFSKDFGGAINLINSSLEIINCTFSYNNAYMTGGAINLYNSNLTITESIFKFNNAKGIYASGGGISSENSIINIEKSFFLDNSADEGGALYCINSLLDIHTCTFSNNKAKWYGGALLSDSPLLIYNSDFNNNKAGYKGGSIHTTTSEFTDKGFLIINNSLMYNNSAEYGSVICSSNLQYVHIYNSEIFNNQASFGAVISRMSGNNIKIINSLCYNNIATNGAILFSLSGGNNSFINDNFVNNKADIGGLIYTISGRISHEITNYNSYFINCNLIDNLGNLGLIYSIFDELIIINSSITYLNKCYNVPIIYKLINGGVIEENNWWGEINPDLNKLIIYEYENITKNKYNNLNNDNSLSEGCASAIIQIDEKNSVISFRRDSDESINVNIIYQKNGILQFKNDPDYFWHVIINNDGWLVGNGGVDTPYSAEKLEAYAKIMIEKNNIIEEILENAFKIKSLLTLSHFFIKAPDGTYGLLIHNISEKKVIVEKGKLKSGEYIISPNNYKYYKKGNISDLNIKDKNYTYISRYLTAIDEYSNSRTNDFTYNYVTTDKMKYVDISVANDGTKCHLLRSILQCS